jgi:hypothetical protein
MLGNILTVNQALDRFESWEDTEGEQLYSETKEWVEAQPKIPTKRVVTVGVLIFAAMIFGSSSSMWLRWLTASLGVFSVIFLIGASLWALRERDEYIRKFMIVVFERDQLLSTQQDLLHLSEQDQATLSGLQEALETSKEFVHGFWYMSNVFRQERDEFADKLDWEEHLRRFVKKATTRNLYRQIILYCEAHPEQQLWQVTDHFRLSNDRTVRRALNVRDGKPPG